MIYKLKNRDVELLEAELEIGEGIYVTSAQFIDNGEALSDEEMEEFSNLYQSELYEDAYADAVNRAHELSEGDR